MLIQNNHVATVHYSVETTDGDIIDSSFDGKPLSFIVGSKFMIEGLEEALIGKQKGEQFEVRIEPDKGYGERKDNLVQTVPLNMFGDMEVEVGMSFRATTDAGEQSVIIIDKNDSEVTVDGNHPLAGISLVFNVSVEDVREATASELSNGSLSDCCSSGSCS